MPTVQIPVRMFRENHMRPSYADFYRMFAERLQARGFAFVQDDDGNWKPAHPLQVSRGDELLTVSQEVPGRVPDDAIAGYLYDIRAGVFAAVGRLCGALLAEGDDRAKILSKLEGSVPEESAFFADTGDNRSTAGAKTEPDAAVIDGKRMAELEICRKALVLFGVMQAKF